MLGKVIDTVREANDLHVGTAGVSVVEAEGLGILEGDLAHCCEFVPAHLADGGWTVVWYLEGRSESQQEQLASKSSSC